MLRDITTTSARVNSDIVPCIRRKYNKPRKSKSDKKRVHFDADGASLVGVDVDGSDEGGKATEEEDEVEWREYAEEEETREARDWEQFDVES